MSVTITLQVDEKLKAKLDQLHPDARRTAEAFTGNLLEYAIDYPAGLDDIEEMLRANSVGDSVTDEDMRAWLSSWGSESELPPHRARQTAELGKLQNIARQVLVLHNRRDHLADVLSVDDGDLFLATARRGPVCDGQGAAVYFAG